MLTVPEPVIQKTQAQRFAFLWKNKKDEIKRQIIYQPISDGGLNFMNFRTMVKSLKQTAMQTSTSSECLFSTPDLLYLSEDSTLPLSKMRCKHYYTLFNECSVSEPTRIKKWKENFPNFFLDWRSNFTKIYQITKDNKFLFKILHRIIITKKELKKFNIPTDDHCNFCSRADSKMHTFLECDVSISVY